MTIALKNIRIDTLRYLASHAKAPSTVRLHGPGNWWFQIGDQTIQRRGTYATACRKAKVFAQQQGEHSITVLP